MWNRALCFFVLLSAVCGILLSVLFCQLRTNREVKSRRIGVCRTGPRAVLLSAHSEKRCVICLHPVILHALCCAGYISPRPLGKRCQEIEIVCLGLKFENPRTRSRTNSCVSCPRTRSSAKSLFGLRALGTVRSSYLVTPRTLRSARLRALCEVRAVENSGRVNPPCTLCSASIV